MKINIKRMNDNAIIPTYGSKGAAGADLYASLDTDSLIIEPHSTEMVHTGISIEIPNGYVGFVCARSGLASKRSLAPANKIGVIDEDFRGEIMVALHNHSNEPHLIKNGERIAQLVITPYISAKFNEVEELDSTERGVGGFGSTGRN